MNRTEEAKRQLRTAILDNSRQGSADNIVEAIEKLIEAKLDDFDDLLRQRQP